MGLRVNRLADEIRAARTDANLSQADLAERIGVSTRTVQNWEAGTVPHPRHRRLLRDFIDFVNGKIAA